MNDRADAPFFFMVPDAIDDPARVSGGNVYDRRVHEGLRAAGRTVRLLPVPDDRDLRSALVAAQLPDGAVVLVDGLIAGRRPAAPGALPRQLGLVVLAHMPPDEGVSFRCAERVIATSHWTRSELIERDCADPQRIVVAQPGTDPAEPTTPSETGGRLLCVGAVAPHKGQDLLISALAGLPDDENWTCTFVGSRDVAPGFVDEMSAAVDAAGLGQRITFTGVLNRRRLAAEYGRADLLVVPSRSESYGMVVTEAFARGIPVVASGAGGLPEAIGRSGAGIVVPPEDPWALGVVLRQWLSSAARRHELQTAAATARTALPGWGSTVAIVASTLDDVALIARREVTA